MRGLGERCRHGLRKRAEDLIKLSPEFELVVACCRWPRGEEAVAGVIRAASAVDWPLLVKVAKRQRVQALVWNALRDAGVAVPEAQALELAADAKRIARQNVELAAESMRLKALFKEAGVPLLFIKGLSLATLAYASISFKMGWDIDILVPGDAVETAGEALSRMGYGLVTPRPSARPGQIRRWHDRYKESVWRDPQRQIHVELHTDLVDNPMLLRGLSPFSSIQEVEVAKGLKLPTLSNDQLFAYLSVHGASSAWFRLKWLADLAALLAKLDQEQIDRLYRRSREMGAGRAPAQALLLCAHLFGTKLGTHLESQLRADPANLWLFHSALAAMAGSSVATELDKIRLGTVMIHLTQFGLLPGWRFKASELRRQLAALRPLTT